MYRFLILTISVLFFVACEKDKPVAEDSITFPTEFSNGLFFVNEGQFNKANASLSFYDAENDTIFSKAYEMVNNQPVGDIFQSSAFDDDNLYLVVNNSGKIIVADKKTLTFNGEITGLPSPRYMEYSGTADLWYVSNLLNDSLFVVNTSNYTIESKEYLGAAVEAMKTVAGKLYLSSPSSDHLYVKDLATNLLDSIFVSVGGNSLIVDNNNSLWLLCNGDFYIPGSAALHQINTDNLTVAQSIGIATGYPSKLSYNTQNNTLYFINTDVYVLKLDEPAAQPEVFIEAAGKSFYGLDVINNNIFVTDAIDYVQNGVVYEYTENGELLKTLTAGVNPNAVVTIP